MPGSLEGRVAIITGGGTGIGRAAAERFAQEGGQVVVCGRRRGPLQETSQAYPNNISYVAADVAHDEERRSVLDHTLERCGRLDILVNNAGVSVHTPFADHTKADMARLFDINLQAPALFILESLPHLIESRGSVINVTSAAARYQGMPPASLSVYSASKAGLNQLTRVLATELGQHGIRVNAVSPGMTDTEIASEAFKQPEYIEALSSITPLGRTGKADDIARVIHFLATDEAGWVTGQVLDATGGFWLAN